MNKKNINKLITVAAIIIVVIVFVPNLNFKSVKKYNEEQEKLVSEQTSDDNNNGVLLYDTDVDNSDDSKLPDDKSDKDKSSSLDKKKKNKNDKSTVKTGDKDITSDNPTKKEVSDKKDTALKGKGDRKSDNKSSDKKSNKKSVTKSSTDKSTVKDNGKKDNNSNKTDDKKDKNQDNKKDDDGEYITCNVSIDCTSVLDNLNMLNVSVRKHIPSNGIMLKESKIKIKKGSNAYDVLVTACKLNKIAYDAEYSKVYSSSYVKGIGYLYEKMAGDMSGWLYIVNGKVPNVGASRYTVNEGDTVTWTYTCSGRAGS